MERLLALFMVVGLAAAQDTPVEVNPASIEAAAAAVGVEIGCVVRSPEVDAAMEAIERLPEDEREDAALLLVFSQVFGAAQLTIIEGCTPEGLLDPDRFPPSAFLAERLDQWSRGRDDHRRYLRLTGFPDPATAERAATESIDHYAVRYAALAPLSQRGKGWSLPTAWPLHPASPNHDPASTRPAWWPTGVPALRPGGLVQVPAKFAPCLNTARGMVAWAEGTTVYVHNWYSQHFYPEGGCGG